MPERAETWPVDWGAQLLPLEEAGRAGPVHGAPIFRASPPAGRPYLALNMVATVDGRAAVGGTPAGVGSPTDQRLMRRLRAEADALLHGAGTLRADRFSPSVPRDLADRREASGLRRQPIGVVVTRSGRLPADHPYFTTATRDWPRLVYGGASPGGLERPGVEVLPTSEGTGLRGVLGDLVRRGVRMVVCEGGPTLNQALLAEGLVDELFLTVAARLVGGHDPLTIVSGDALELPPLHVQSVFERDSELFLRYRVAS